MTDFAQLVCSRKDWLDRELRPWCAAAPLRELKKAEAEWSDIAGRVDAEATLWTWAWSRFDDLVHEGLSGVSETFEVEVTLKDGSRVTGFPDARKSKQGRLYLVCRSHDSSEAFESGPHSIDDIVSVRRHQP